MFDFLQGFMQEINFVEKLLVYETDSRSGSKWEIKRIFW